MRPSWQLIWCPVRGASQSARRAFTKHRWSLSHKLEPSKPVLQEQPPQPVASRRREEPPREMNIRLTYRTIRALGAIWEQPGASNRMIRVLSVWRSSKTEVSARIVVVRRHGTSPSAARRSCGQPTCTSFKALMAGAASIWLCAGLPCPDAPDLLPRLGCECRKIRLLEGSADLIECHIAVGMAVEIGHESPAVAMA